MVMMTNLDPRIDDTREDDWPTPEGASEYFQVGDHSTQLVNLEIDPLNILLCLKLLVIVLQILGNCFELVVRMLKSIDQTWMIIYVYDPNILLCAYAFTDL